MKQRSAGLDLIRTLAILFVMATHAIAHLAPMNTGIHSPKWTAYVILRFTSLCCVPLFLMLTGYLNRKKKPTAAYYKGILPILLSYAAISALGLLYGVYTGRTSHTLFSGLRAILDYSANGYAWYVEMYIGLFLLIPFLNILFDAIGTLRGRLLLCVLLTAATMLPTTVASFRVNGTSLAIFPEYWKSAYPLVYYFVGAMIAEYRPKLKVPIRALLVLIAIAVPSGLCYIYSSPSAGYAWYMMNGFGCITTGAVALTVFLAFYDVNLPKPLSFLVREISVCTFEMYLFSYTIDQIVYKLPRYFMPFMVLTVFGLSYLCARVLRLILVPLTKRLKGA